MTLVLLLQFFYHLKKKNNRFIRKVVKGTKLNRYIGQKKNILLFIVLRYSTYRVLKY